MVVASRIFGTYLGCSGHIRQQRGLSRWKPRKASWCHPKKTNISIAEFTSKIHARNQNLYFVAWHMPFRHLRVTSSCPLCASISGTYRARGGGGVQIACVAELINSWKTLRLRRTWHAGWRVGNAYCFRLTIWRHKTEAVCGWGKYSAGILY